MKMAQNWVEERPKALARGTYPEQLKGKVIEGLIYRRNWKSLTMARKIPDYAVWRMERQKARPDPNG